jgi:hypothetical protein
MAAHAVNDREQHRAFGVGDGDPVLVLVAMADEAEVGVLDLQASLRHAFV